MIKKQTKMECKKSKSDRKRRKLRRNPIRLEDIVGKVPVDLENFVDAVFTVFKGFKFGIVNKEKRECRCGGLCICHSMQIGGFPCPSSCKNYGKKFDGCHNCDCEE